MNELKNGGMINGKRKDGQMADDAKSMKEKGGP